MKRRFLFLLILQIACIELFSQSIETGFVRENLPCLAEGVVDTTQYETAGLPPFDGTQTVSVFKPTDATCHYNNSAVMTAFKGRLYCMWQSSLKDEDAPDTRLVYSVSDDEGLTWTEPKILEDATDTTYSTSGGWLVCGDTLTAFLTRWPVKVEPRGGYTYYKYSTDGVQWSEAKPVMMADGRTMDGAIEQDPMPLDGGRIIGAAHFMPGLHVCPVFTNDPTGHGGWRRATFDSEDRGKQSRELEPSQYLKPDGTLVMIFRDQDSSFRKMASLSTDRGETWTKPELTNIPDGRTKQCAGNLPDGTSYMVSCPANGKRRWPLVLQLSSDGTNFDKAFLLRSGERNDLPMQRYAGRYKTLGYSYPKSIVWNGKLYISYSTNKEGVECTIIPLDYVSK